jgi:Protein of unknown function (DUF3455)
MMISSRVSNAFRLRPLGVTMAASAVLLLAAAALSGAARADDQRAPDLVGDCVRLRVGPGNKVAFHAFGVGVQIYRWSGTNWVFVAPEAVLYANAGDDAEIGIHFGGPTWQSNSGSKVVGTVIDRCTPDPSAIPWLLLSAASTEGPGIFDQVTFIQRVNTVGGNAPDVPGGFTGQIARVLYSADYYFYRDAGQ